jgi:selenocysteine lyase/cysteine desulfurase
MADFGRVREAFPATKHVTYLDLANKNILPQPVIDEIGRFVQDAGSTGGDKDGWKRVVEETRAEVAGLIGAGPDEIAFVKNTSEGLNAAARGLGLEQGDVVVLNDLEHPNNVYPWLALARHGVEVRWVRSRDGRIPLEDLERQIAEGARVVAISHVTSASGFRTDLAALGRACRQHGARLVVDAIQSAGVVPVDVGAAGVDLLACGAHKGLLGVHGVGVLYCRRELIPSMTPVYAARDSMSAAAAAALEVRFAPDARRFEIGNPNYLGIHALRAGVRFVREIGAGAIESRVLALSGLVLDGLRARGIASATPSVASERAGIVSARVADPEAAVRRLAARGIVVSVKGGALRVTPHVYNTEDEIERLLALLPAAA